MILQALVKLYEDLLNNGSISPPGWEYGKVSFAIYIDKAGNLMQIVPTMEEIPSGKKNVMVPQKMIIPAHPKRSSGIEPGFLCDHSGYLLGVDNKGKPDRSQKCFESCKALHRRLLAGVNSQEAEALIAFFDKWDPAKALEHPALKAVWDEVSLGGNMVFRFNGIYLQDVPEIKEVWNEHYDVSSNGPEMVCLVTGKTGSVEAIHPAIKGVRDAQSSGAALVSFNAPAFCSYGKEQNYNAPISKYAAFAYTAALNYLLKDREHMQYIGDTAVLSWAEGADAAYRGMLNMCLLGSSDKYSQQEIMDKMFRLANGLPVEFEEERLDPERPFYILGIAPNAARLSVRFFLKDTFGHLLENVMHHHERMEIVRPEFDRFPIIPLWKMLNETVNQNSKEKKPSPVMAGEVLRAVLTDTRYPATLLNGVNLRIRSEHTVTRGRAAIIKAYYLKNMNKDVPEEVLQVSLNPDSSSIPYQLGRMFSVLESIQSAANPGINSTIKDKYFNSASATPAMVFPVLINLAQKHLRKIGGGLKVVLEKDLEEVMGKLGEEYPKRLNLAQQGAFQLGYYHQTQARYQGKKKEEL